MRWMTWFRAMNPFWSTYENFISYLRNESIEKQIRKQYFYDHVTDHYFSQLRLYSNRDDLQAVLRVIA